MRVALLTLTMCLLALPANAKYSGGSGTANDPYQIATAADLIALGETPTDYGKHFVLTADIDLDPKLPGRKVFDTAVIAPDPVASFTGTFDGRGHVIRNLKIIGGMHVGLFGSLGPFPGSSGPAVVSHLGLEAVEVSGTGWCVGGLVGYNYWGHIVASYCHGLVSGTQYHVGGLVGYNSGGSIVASYSTGTVHGQWGVGGLVSYNDGSIVASHSTGLVKGTDFVGGLVGDNGSGGSIVASYSGASVSGSSHVGGLAGHNSGTISSSFWDIQTSGQTTSAGGTGKTMAELQSIETFLNAGWDFVEEVANGTCDYWEIAPGGYPRLHFQGGNHPLMPEGLGAAEQPYLIRDARDLGTMWFEPQARYRLAQSVDLSGIRWSMAVIPWFGGSFDGSGYVISNLQIQGGSRLGLFGESGSTASVSNLGLEAVEVHGTGSSIGGLVGHNNGSIVASYSRGSVTGIGSVGGLVGTNAYTYGSIARSYSSGSVTGGGAIGGLVGYNTWRIVASYSTSLVTGTNHVGGLAGHNYGSVVTSYSHGSVSGVRAVGGLVGYNDYYGVVSRSYSRGSVTGTSSVGGLVGDNEYDYLEGGGIISRSFWDVQTSSRTTSDGGTGKTTAEMQTAGTFLAAQWDFVGETTNGTEDLWWILEGKDYPRLWWEAAGN